MKIILNVIGIVIFFLSRFSNRKDKTTEPSIKFWFKDNWEQLITIGLFDVALMILASKQALNIDFSKLTFLPDWLQLVGDVALFFVIGLLGAYLAYEGYQKRVIDKR